MLLNATEVSNDTAVTTYGLRALINIVRNAMSNAKEVICSTYCHISILFIHSPYDFANIVSTRGRAYRPFDILPFPTYNEGYTKIGIYLIK
jgi:hypothetical protein